MVDAVTRDATHLAPAGAGSTDASGAESAIPLGAGTEQGLTGDAPPAFPEPSELIEPGRALAIADFAPPSLGAGERLIRLAYRAGVPASMLTLPLGRKSRPRILAAVANPLRGDAAAGKALRAGHFLVHGVKLAISQADFRGAARMTPPFEQVVHSFSWLDDLDVGGSRDQVTPVAARLLTAWLDANPKAPARPGKRPAWLVANAGTRVLNWLVHAPLMFANDDAELRKRVLAALDDTARWLDRNVTSADDRLAELAGWCGLVAAGLLMADGKPRRLFGEAGLVRALGELVGDDGGVLSRSPLGQMEALALLVKLRACYEAAKREPPAALETMLALLVPPLLSLTHGDGSLGSWQGAWAIDAGTSATLVEASGVRTRPLRDVRQWGYQRIAAQKSILQFDAAPPPLARHARNGCASTLAFEFSHAGERIVVNCGGAACAGGLVPVRLEQGLRATAAHSTLVLDDANSTAVLLGGEIGAGVREVEVDRRVIEADRASRGAGLGATRLEASHDGYGLRYGLVHRRILILRDDGTELRGEDLLVPNGRKGKRGKVAYAIRFHLGPDIEARLSEDGRGAGIALADGSYWQFRVGEGEVTIEDSIWVDGHARPIPIQQLVMQGLVSRGGGNFSWLLKKMG
jgi:uncharacterized heparinase superfamily protein